MKQRKANVRERLVVTSLCVVLALTTVFASVSMAGGTQADDERLTVIGCIRRSEADVPSTPGVAKNPLLKVQSLKKISADSASCTQ